MFVAINRSGALCSIFQRSKTYIERLKKEGPFYCPSCKQEVILKVGTRKLPHFAHKKICPVKGEGESQEHMTGKIVIFQWLKKSGFTPEIEKYLPEMNQRPDLYFQWNGKKIAVEFQCSVIPFALVKKRTDQYEKYGFTPIWIVHEKLIRKTYQDLIHFTDFSALFIQNFRYQSFLLSFDPKLRMFFRYTHFLPISKQRAWVDEKVFSSQDHWLQVFEKQIPSFAFYDFWPDKMERWMMTRSLQPRARGDQFLLYFYRHHLHPTRFPPEVGLPLPHMYTIATPPFEWQAYLWHRFLFEKKIGDSFTVRDVYAFVLKEMKGVIQWRNLALFKEFDPMTPIWNYFRFFMEIGLLTKEGDTFMLEKPGPSIFNRGADGSAARKDFFRRYKGIILKKFWLTDSKNKYIL
ncbi:competence protein CoiA [Fervidibacillus albus]|uniref:Competence protein CoiA family protein n=1 Tax=Fervidibacillus albus TaxID=2980026 RepID=A0A9E8LS96_9BACI|nr:competence protein CoiA family protein [Fervidibacillus albus]WAA08653.1 competence protein CoiA family protein [Fervidibacillus albus]